MTTDRCFCVRLEYYFSNGEEQAPHFGWVSPDGFIYPDNEQPKGRLTIDEACDLAKRVNQRPNIQIIQIQIMSF